MIFDERTAQYVNTAIRFINNGGVSIQITTTCPECGETPNDLDPWDGHVLMRLADDRFIVLIGCEGYWVINPNDIGIKSDTWLPPDA